METFISSPIFVFITGLSQVLIVVFGAIVLGYLVAIIHNVNRISRLAKIEAENIAADIEQAREDIKDGVELAKKRVKLAVGAMSVKKIFDLVMARSGVTNTRRQGRRTSTRKSSDS